MTQRNPPGQLTGQPLRERSERARHPDPVDNIHECCPFQSSEKTASRPQPCDYADSASPPAPATSGNPPMSA